LKPWQIGAGLAVAAALVVLNFAAVTLGADAPALVALDLVADLAVLSLGIAGVVWLGLRADAQSARVRAALDEREARLAAIVDSAMDAVITVDGSQRIVLFNRAAEAVFRCRRDDMLGERLERLLPARFREAHRIHIQRFGETGVTNRRMGEGPALRGLRSDGEEFPLEASISHTQQDGKDFYTVILRDITRREQYEQAIRRQQHELRELSARVLEAREEEKTLIARELHDELGQLLTALKLDLAFVRDRLPAGAGELPERAAKMDALLDRTVNSVRRISAELRPLMLDDLGLADGMAWLVDDFSTRTGIRTHLTMPEAGAGLDGLERNVANTLYRVLQESLTNVTRHAAAQNAWIVLAAEGNHVRLEVEDDGRGIADEDLQRPRSLGLKGMRERVLYLGGTVDIGRAVRGGTRVAVRLPRLPMRETAP
jgi:PAS domain S-box-containing protein